MASAVGTGENNVKKIYLTVIDEVLSNVREPFLDEGYDEQLLQELKNMWVSKLNASRALQAPDDTTNESSSHRLPATTKDTTNIKTEMDSATRSALNALPHSFHSASSSGSHSNGKKLHASQLDGAADDMTEATATTSKSKSKAVKLSKPQKVHITLQLDGIDDDSDIDDDDEDDIGEVSIHGDEDEDDADDDKAGNSEYEGKEDPDPLNSDDDLTEPGTPDSNADLFDTDNVIVCQYDKITRIKNRWKFHLKDGIMNINARDYMFCKANGDAEW